MISSFDIIFTDVVDLIFKSSSGVSPKAKISIPPCVALIVIASFTFSLASKTNEVFDTILISSGLELKEANVIEFRLF